MRKGPALAALLPVHGLPWVHTCGSLGPLEVEMDGQQEKSMHSTSLCISRTTFSLAAHSNICQAAGSREEVMVAVVVADPRQLYLLLLLASFSTPYEEVGSGDRCLVSQLLLYINPSCYRQQEGEWGEGAVAGAQLGNTSTPDGGLKCTYGGLKCTGRELKCTGGGLMCTERGLKSTKQWAEVY
jgi:hypothetical protein